MNVNALAMEKRAAPLQKVLLLGAELAASAESRGCGELKDWNKNIKGV